MFKKTIILASVLLFISGAVFTFVNTEKNKEQQQAAVYRAKYGSELEKYVSQYSRWPTLSPERKEQLLAKLEGRGSGETAQQLREKQRQRLQADMDRLVTGEAEIYPFAENFYGRDWQRQVLRYKAKRERTELVLTASLMGIAISSPVFAWCILLLTARGSIKVTRYLKKVLIDSYHELKSDEKRDRIKAVFVLLFGPILSRLEKPHQQKKPAEKPKPSQQSVQPKPELEKGLQPLSISDDDDEKIETLYTDQPPEPQEQILQKPVATAAEQTDEKETGDLQTQIDQLNQQTCSLLNECETVQQDTAGNDKTIENSIKNLTDQVSAIREYASNQQGRMQKLQDGYDWNIIRNFCMRIIRCIDNLENRITRLGSQGADTTELKLIRDEVIFSLESSGIEQFTPELNSSYRGQEKLAEAISQRQPCEDPKHNGKIADVVRPGYRYCIDEDNFKIVRTAQVKLFGKQ